MSLSTWLPWVACAGVGAVALVSAAQSRELARRIEVLEATPAVAPTRAGTSGEGTGTGPALVVGGGPVSKVELDTLRREVAALDKRLSSAAAAPAAGSGAAGAGSAAFEQGRA